MLALKSSTASRVGNPADRPSEIVALKAASQTLGALLSTPAGETTQPLRRGILPNWLRLRGSRQGEQVAAAASPRTEARIDGKALREWLVRALVEIDAPGSPGVLTFAAGDEPGAAKITLTTVQETRQHWLRIESGTFEEIDLRDIHQTNLVVYIANCTVDWISLSRSHLSEVELRNLQPNDDWFGMVIIANDTRIQGTLRLQGDPASNEPPRRNHYISFDAQRLSAAQVVLWGIQFTGALWLARILKARDERAYNVLFERFSRSVMLTETRLDTLLVYDCEFTGGLVSTRHAQIARRVKFERCAFTEAYLPQFFGQKHNRRALLDEFDHDDLRSLKARFSICRAPSLAVNSYSGGLSQSRRVG